MSETSSPDLSYRTSPGITADDIAVVICAYNEDRFALLLRAIDSVVEQSAPVAEIVVVIDNCPGLHDRMLREHATRQRWRGVRIVTNERRQGLSGARNTGVSATSTTIVAFLDDDARAEPDWAENIAAGYTDDSVRGVGGLALPEWQDGPPGWFPAEMLWVVGCSYRGLPTGVAPVRNFIGASMSLRRADILSAGGFRAEMGRVGADTAGCEETELCIRIASLRQRNWLRHDPAVVARHTVPTGRSTLGYFLRRCRSEGRSKALVTHSVGSSSGLASERTYTMRVLPAGVATALRRALSRERPAPTSGSVRRRDHAARAGVIVLGLAVTTTGYLEGRLRRSTL